MRVCHILHSLKVGGAEMLVARMARERDRQQEISVVCLDEIGVLGEELIREGIQVRCTNRRPGVDLPLVGRVQLQLKQLRPDIVHAHQYTPWFYGGWAAANERIPLVFTEHGRHQPDRPRMRRVLFNKWLLRRTAAVTAVSHSIRQALIENEKIPADRIDVVYNGVDQHRLAPDLELRGAMRQELSLVNGTLAIGTAGRLVEVKNHRLLLSALALLAERRPGLDFQVFVAGSGPLLNELEAQRDELGLSERVQLLGEREDVPSLLNAWDVFVLPSLSEGTSVTLLEALSTAVPVVATRVGGNPELVHDGVEGILVPSEDAGAIADALGHLAEDRGRRQRMGEAGRRRVLERFTHDGMLERFDNIYAKVVAS